MAGDPRVAVVGATGAVGSQLVELISARGFSCRELKLFATQRGASGTIESGGEQFLVHELENPDALADFDIAFLALPQDPAAAIVAARPGPILIDLSGAARAPSDAAPLVSPSLVPRERIGELKGRGVFSVPHPAAHVQATCLAAIEVRAGFVAATAMLGASAGGRDRIALMVDQTTDLLNARLDLEDDETQRSFNVFMREHERAVAAVIASQAAALLRSEPELCLQAVTIPVLHGSALSIAIPRRTLPADPIVRLRGAPGILLVEDAEPLGIIDAVGQEAIFVRAEDTAAGLALWCTYDNARLAALAALWVAETLTLATTSAN